MENTYCCPRCGEPLERGQRYYDETTDRMRVDHCPYCNDEDVSGEVCEEHENE